MKGFHFFSDEMYLAKCGFYAPGSALMHGDKKQGRAVEDDKYYETWVMNGQVNQFSSRIGWALAGYFYLQRYINIPQDAEVSMVTGLDVTDIGNGAYIGDLKVRVSYIDFKCGNLLRTPSLRGAHTNIEENTVDCYYRPFE